jgi:hypothetical protein
MMRKKREKDEKLIKKMKKEQKRKKKDTRNMYHKIKNEVKETHSDNGENLDESDGDFICSVLKPHNSESHPSKQFRSTNSLDNFNQNSIQNSAHEEDMEVDG